MGKTGLRLSALSLGAWVTFGGQVKDENVVFDAMLVAKEAGVNFFDNAESYSRGNGERVMGNVLKKSGWRRSELVISTKIFFGSEGNRGPNDTGLSRKHIIEGMNDSLKRLQLDYVDIVFCHRPDPTVPIEETVRAMNNLIHHNKAFYWGTSEWSAQQIQEAIGIADRLGLIPPQVEQPQYNMLTRTRVEVEYEPLYHSQGGLGLTTWSPLATGLLTGKYNNGIPENSRLAFSDVQFLRDQFINNLGVNGIEEKDTAKAIAKVKALVPVAEELGVTQAQLAIAWCLKNKYVTSVITGATSAAQVAENMKALEVVPKLTDQIMERIEAILQNKPTPPKVWRRL